MTTTRICIERVVERVTGVSIEALRRTPLDELRQRFRQGDPYGGLQPIDRRYVVTSQQADRLLREALYKK